MEEECGRCYKIMVETGLLYYWTFFWKYIGWWVVPIIIMFIYKKRLQRHPIECIIYEKRGKDLIWSRDVAGRFGDPVHSYKLKNNKDSIPIPDYDWVMQCAYKPTNFFEKLSNMMAGKIGTITLFKYSSKQYKPVYIKFKDGSSRKILKEVKDKDGQPVYIYVYEPIKVTANMSNLEFEVIDWDDINHMTQELRAIALRRSPILNFLEKYGGWIAFMLGVLILIFGGYYYKEMILDGGAQAASMIKSAQGGGSSPTEVNNISSTTDIPLIGDLINR